MTGTCRRSFAEAIGAALLFAVALAPLRALAEEPARPRRPAPPSPPRGDGEAPPMQFSKGEPDEISGRVVSPSGGLLPTGLEIWIRPLPLHDGEKMERSIRVGKEIPIPEDGVFSVRGLDPARSYEVSAHAHLQRLAEFRRVPAGSREVVLTLKAGGSIRGRVLDAEGRPVGAGVPVDAYRALRYSPWCGTIGPGECSGTRTIEDGTFVVEYLARTEFTVTARRDAPGGSQEAASAQFIPEGSSDVVLRLAVRRPRESLGQILYEAEASPHEPAATAITGRVLHPHGASLSPHVTLQVEPESGGKARHVLPSPSGRFDSGTLGEGTWTIRAMSNSGLLAAEKRGVPAGTRGIEIPLDPGGTIAGRVFGPDGLPVGAGYRVGVEQEDPAARGPGRHSESITREDGSFLIEYLGELEFAVQVRGYIREYTGPKSDDWVSGDAARRLRPGSAGIALHLVPKVGLLATLHWADGSPATEVEVQSWQSRRLSRGGTRTDASGTLRLPYLAAGPVHLVAKLGKKEFDLGEHDLPCEVLSLRLSEMPPVKKPR